MGVPTGLHLSVTGSTPPPILSPVSTMTSSIPTPQTPPRNIVDGTDLLI